MTRSWIAATLMLLALCAGPLPATADGGNELQGGSIMGRVQELDHETRTFSVGDVAYYVPPDVVGLEQLSIRSVVRVEFEELDGRHVASSIQRMD